MKTIWQGWLAAAGIGAGLGALAFALCPQGHADEAVEATVIAVGAGPIALGAGATRIPLAPGGAAEGAALAARLRALRADQRVYLVLRDLRATAQPGVLYHLYLDLPPGARPGRDDPRRIGTLNFFAASASGSLPFRSYDITPVVRSLQARKLLGDSPALTIAPAGRPAGGARPTIRRIELVEQRAQ